MTLTTDPAPSGPAATSAPFEEARRGRRGVGDRVFEGVATSAGLVILLALAGVFVFLAVKGADGLHLASTFYRPAATSFLGYVGPLVFGTALAAVLALLIAVPFAIAIALFISHYAPRRIATPVAYLIDLLAAVPSVVYGLWGGVALADALKPAIAWLNTHLGFLPFFDDSPAPSVTGRTMITAALVLAVMILPIVTAISREIFAQTPRLNQEAAMALGATRWEVVRISVLPYAKSGIVSAVMLGLGRALGETMAVLMVLSSSITVSLNLIASSSPATIASNIAANYKEATPGRQSLLIATGLVLFAFTFLVNFAARWVVGRGERRMAR